MFRAKILGHLQVNLSYKIRALKVSDLQIRLNLTFTIPKCLKYRNKGKDHNSQTQQYFLKFLKYINNNNSDPSGW